MSASEYVILADDCPADIPSRDEIVALCRSAGYSRNRSGIPFPYQEPGPISAWIKFGTNATMDEALTQDTVGKILNANPEAVVRVPRVFQAFTTPNFDYPIGYIVMEYIDFPDCDKGDVQLVARAVQELIGVKGPSDAPGHVCGGLIVHRFFYEWTSPAPYKTVKELEDHVNSILKIVEDPRRVNLVDDARDGLYLCPCDLNPANFKKGPDGTIVALDFAASCFVPRSFIAASMNMMDDYFSRRVARCVNYQQSNDVSAILRAGYSLVPYGSNKIGIPKSVRERIPRRDG